DRVCIQSFDIETLQRVKAIKPNLTLALLIENKLSFEQNLQNLGFDPEIYSPSFELVNEALIVQCAARNIKVIPWAVNQEADVLRMINLDVDGIITDYPGLVKEMLTENGISIE
ncbi:MAG: glycerophosphodiester phosphodiesterase, partial [Salibacteraceae bacterium]|nr:glycerophosphodiester phosphodiesterase [Salibacteraceae bacterium]